MSQVTLFDLITAGAVHPQASAVSDLSSDKEELQSQVAALQSKLQQARLCPPRLATATAAVLMAPVTCAVSHPKPSRAHFKPRAFLAQREGLLVQVQASAEAVTGRLESAQAGKASLEAQLLVSVLGTLARHPRHLEANAPPSLA